MPLPPLAPNNTDRLFVDYSAQGEAHKMIVRYNTGLPPSTDLMTQVEAFLTALNGLMPTNYAVTGYSYQIRETIVTLPLARLPVTVAGTLTPQAGAAPAYYTFVGRSTGGRKCKLFVLGAGNNALSAAGALNNYRWTSAENALVASAIAALDDCSPVGVDRQPTVWYPYVNLGFNYHWQQRPRA